MSDDVNNTAIRSAAPQSSVFITLVATYSSYRISRWRTCSHSSVHNKLRYCEEHSASVVLSWCTSWHLSGENLL